MKLTLKKKSPVSDGIYTVKVEKITFVKGVVTKNGVRDRYDFSFVHINKDGEHDFTCSLFWSSYEASPFGRFVNRTMENFNIAPDEELETDDFVGKTVSARFGTYRDKNGDEQVSLEWFAPYNNTMEVNSND